MNALQQASAVPLLISADFEKGVGTHVDGATDLPINMALGASRDTDLVYRGAKLTAGEARAIGVHINFAPVMDVNNNAKNPIINIRSYGEDPTLVARLSMAAIRGYQENGLLATGKHFPGHGNTSVDSHSKLGTVESSEQEFESVELLPYKAAVRETDLAAIMTAHLWVKAVDQDTIPSTFSRKVLMGILRKRLGFDGIIFPDALVMGGITSRYDLDVTTINTIKAGCDIILWPGNVETSFNMLTSAVVRGEFLMSRIDESVRRILRAKTRKKRLIDVERIPGLVGTPQNYEEAKRIAAGCLTLVKNEAKLVPLNPGKRILVLTMDNGTRNVMMSRTLVSFPGEMMRLSQNVSRLDLSEQLNKTEVDEALTRAGNADVVVIAAYIRIVLGSGTLEMPEAQKELVGRVIDRNPRVILISFGNPYIGGSVGKLSTYICAYDNAKALQEVAAEALFGKIAFKGRLPVTVSESMRFGDGRKK